MRRTPRGDVRCSPSDLVTWWESAFASWMDRYALARPREVEPAEEDEAADIVKRRGLEHERAFLEDLRRGGKDVEAIPEEGDRVGRTRRAMAAGREWIYQAALECAPFGGYADFLQRVDGPSRLGGWHYEPWDTKLARSPKPHFVLQLCAYADLLEAEQGKRPGRIHVALGSGETRTFRTDDYFFQYRAVRRAFLAALAAFDPSARPEPEIGAGHGRWQEHADRILEEADHVSRVAGITRLQVRRLGAEGIATLADLAGTSRRRPPKRMSAATFERLRRQARLQRDSAGRRVPVFEVLDAPGQGLARLPPASPLDVFFDMEGYPHLDGGLEYLFGAAHADGDGAEYRDWWAHDAAEERAALEGFVDWAHARWREDPAMHVYHYGSYEVTALRRLMGRYGTREEEVDDLLRNEVFTDLLAVVRTGLQVGTRGYSIKDLEPLYQGARAEEVKTAGESIVQYHLWRESGEPRDWRRSSRLAALRAYNRQDCESTLRLAAWLRERQAERRIAFVPRPRPEVPEEEPPKVEAARLRRESARRLLAAVPEDPARRESEADRWRIQELLAHLLEFHRREDKPVWWALYARREKSEEELTLDLDCLAGLEREDRPVVPLKRSKGFWYRYDPDQDTKLDVGSGCAFAHDVSLHGEVHEMDRDAGRVCVRVGPKPLARMEGGEPPHRVSLLPFDLVRADPIPEAIHAVARAWETSGRLPGALDAFLRRTPPKVRGGARGDLVRPGEDAGDACVRLAPLLADTTLCIQGPPGSGKTHTAARMILSLVASGKRVGVAANSHAAVLNVLKKCAELANGPFRFLKVGGDAADPVLAACRGALHAKDGNDGAARLGEAPVVGGTAWLFARDDVAGAFDHLFVDEAGQVSVANLVGMSRAARNLVLIGDQMQLGQPIQGSHPGESGLSVLEYYLRDRATIPPETGVFLDRSRRLHPRLCSFVSGAFYEDRLRAAPGTERRVVRLPADPRGVPLDAGLLCVPVEHEGNSQSSEQEVERVLALVRDLVGRTRTDSDGKDAGSLDLPSLLFVAPYNMQVRLLRRALGPSARVASVDKFQGQEAPVVVVSMCSSEGDASPRGLEFLLHRNRLNVAISRAQSLAVVVGHPRLGLGRCSSLRQMLLANTWCRIVEEGTPSG